MKTISLRALAREAPTVSEAVLVVHSGQIIGTFKPFGDGNGVIDLGNDITVERVELVKDAWKEASVDEPVKKAIEPEQVRQTDRGKLSKGLGHIPGTPEPKMQTEFVGKVDAYQEFRPAPKPKK